jgi:hypothetical protein
MLGAVVGSSLIFFIVTNFAVWLYFDLYTHTWSGLLDCYLQAVPFYRYTLAGDAVFATVLFGSLAVYRLCVSSVAAARLTQAANPS